MSGALAVVTGANRGIGLELSRQLKEAGYSVVAACRKASTELNSLGVSVVEGVDLGDLSTLAKVADACAGKPIALLLNNAGILATESGEGLAFGADSFEAMKTQFEVNALGTLGVTWTLRPLLQPGSRVLVITSRMGSIADNSSGGRYGYRMSKAALNAAAVSLARDLTPAGVAVGILHPGLVESGMTASFGAKAGVGSCVDSKTSAAGILKHADLLNLENSGTFWHALTGEVLPW